MDTRLPSQISLQDMPTMLLTAKLVDAIHVGGAPIDIGVKVVRELKERRDRGDSAAAVELGNLRRMLLERL